MRTTLPNLGWTLALVVGAVLAPSAVAQERTGAQIYKQMCARCHGAAGEGTKKYELPLVGDKSVAQLANLIDRTMPEDDPDALDAADARKVAEYIHEAFYSAAAQARLKPPRIELARLTVRQYRNSVADLIGSFRPAAKLDERRGLRGEYFNSRGFQPKARLIDRIDPEVNFDFGTSGPKLPETTKDQFDPHQFSIRWEGSVLAPETGVYEFVVRTDHAARLWVNNPRQPLIDAWVKSGSDTEYRAAIFLLAGRAYALRLEFSKAKQGVDDSQKNKNLPPKPAFVALAWKPPHRVDEVIPARLLMPVRVPEVAVLETPFPPDDRSRGWERATTISREWGQAATDAALEAAGFIVARLPELAGGTDLPKLKQFGRRFAERAFRRPLTDEEQKLFIDQQFAATTDPELAVKRLVLLVLQSPRFLYPEASGGPEQYRVASRLALVLWDSLPDQTLLDAAAAGKLGTRAEVQSQAQRMLADPRAKAKLREFLLTWLKVEQHPELVKDAKRFPDFTPAIASDLRTSLELFLDDVLWGENPDFRKLLLADDVFLNGRLAKFYGVDLPADAGFQKVKFEPDRRAGVLTHPYLLSALAYQAESSPIHRGVFVARGLLGVLIRPPQEAFTPLSPDLHPTLTTRERVTLQTKALACASCHGIMNPVGFTLEHFDAVGRYRQTDRDKPVDASGSYEKRDGTLARFTGAEELARFLADSPEVPATFAERLFQHLVKQPLRAFGPTRPEELAKTFSELSYDLRKLVLEVAAIAALETKPPK
jgi:cytochrome c553